MLPASAVLAAENPFSPEECAASCQMDELDATPAPVQQGKPKVPSELEGVKASVVVAFIIDERGRVIGERIVQSTNSSFDTIAMNCVRDWKFQPATRSGSPVKVRVVVPIRFNSGGRN
jgi:protein TonB